MSDTGAYEAAVRLLAASDKTPGELIKRLTEKGYTEEQASGAAARLTAEGYLREDRLAEKTVRRLFEKQYGRAYIIAYMREKGFSDDAVEEAEAMCDTLDFDAAAEDFTRARRAEGKTETQIRSALYRRGFEI